MIGPLKAGKGGKGGEGGKAGKGELLDTLTPFIRAGTRTMSPAAWLC